jgi:ribosome-associated toxin RatA of RatAB toxin-antitoxin module
MQCSVVLDADVPGWQADDVFARVADFARYPQLTAAVRKVTIEDDGAEGLVSTWEVNFRKGILVWTERDQIDRDSRRIEFTQTKGDFAMFTGTWTVEETGTGTRVRFASRFDLGIASLASLVDPVACRALRDSVHDILKGLFGEEISIHDIEAAPLASA